MLVRAVRIREPGGPEVLELGEHEVRAPGASELLVHVAAAGLNRADLLQRKGRYPPPPGLSPAVPGLEYAGTVAATGEGVTLFRPGDRVMGIVGGEAMAEALVVHEREAIPVPPALSLTDAAGIPEVFLTAWDAILVQGELTLGETLLVHAVGSGVGTAAVQLARAVGASSIGTSRTADKLPRCAALGMHHGIEAADGRFAARVHELTNGRGADVILDSVGGAYLPENVDALGPRGRLILIGTLGGARGELPLSALMQKRARVIGTVLRSRPLEEKALLARRFTREVLPLFQSGALRPVIEAVLPMAEIAEAHRRLEAGDTLGKLVLSW